MCRNVPGWKIVIWIAAASFQPILCAQTEVAWRHLGNSALDLGLAAVTTGPVDRVWYSEDGNELYAITHSGQAYVSDDRNAGGRGVVGNIDLPGTKCPSRQ